MRVSYYFSVTDGEEVGFNMVTLLPTPFQICCMFEYVCMHIPYLFSLFLYMFKINTFQSHFIQLKNIIYPPVSMM